MTCLQIAASLTASIVVSLSGVHAAYGASPSAIKQKTFDFQLDQRPFIGAGLLVDIESYDPKAHIYHLTRPDVPNAVTLYATPTNLAHAIDTVKLDAIQKNPDKIVSNEYALDRDLYILDQTQLKTLEKWKAKNAAAPATKHR